MKFGIVTFPGSNCDYDAFHAVRDALGEDATYLWHRDHDLPGVLVCPTHGVWLERSGVRVGLTPGRFALLAAEEVVRPTAARLLDKENPAEQPLLRIATDARWLLHWRGPLPALVVSHGGSIRCALSAPDLLEVQAIPVPNGALIALHRVSRHAPAGSDRRA